MANNKKNPTITVNNGQTKVARVNTPTPTPLTEGQSAGEKALAEALERALAKKRATLMAGEEKVIANTMRGHLTNDPKKKVRTRQASLIAAALAGYRANNGAVGEWTKDVKAVLSAGRNATSELMGDLGPDELEDAFEVVEQKTK